MTKEELEKEATEYANEWGDKTDGTYASCKEGYMAGAKYRKERITDLEEENEKLRFNLDYAKAIMRELLDNSNEYARARAEDFLEEKNK